MLTALITSKIGPGTEESPNCATKAHEEEDFASCYTYTNHGDAPEKVTHLARYVPKSNGNALKSSLKCHSVTKPSEGDLEAELPAKLTFGLEIATYECDCNAV